MHSTLIQNIAKLILVNATAEPVLKGAQMQQLAAVDNAFLLIENGLIKLFGKQSDVPERADEVIDASGRIVLPAWCDAHTHLVYASSRAKEFVSKIKGLSYEEIAAQGGGILNSAKKLNETSESELFDAALQRLDEIKNSGTGAVEIKSGYGLTVEGELKMLRVIRRLKEHSSQTIKSTFLGAHAFPIEYKSNRSAYITLIIDKMLPQIADEQLADFIDVFCDEGFFTPDETARILDAGVKHGLKPKLHANELAASGGIEIGVQFQARSVDHLEHTYQAQIETLKQSSTMPVLLPSTAFYLNLEYAPARRMIDNGLPVALATDFNPGTSPSGNMPLVIALACIKMKMLPEEAIAAATVNSAYAMMVENELGSIGVGKKANIIITKPMNELAEIPYYFGSNPVAKVIISK